MVLVLPSFSKERPGGAALASWWLFTLAGEVTEVLALMGAIEALKAQGLTRPVVVHMFIQRWILPLRERVHPLWQHQGITDPMMDFPYPISKGLLRVLMIGAVGANYLGADASGLSPFSTEHPPPAGHPFAEMMSEPPIPPSEVVWMATPPTGTPDTAVLAFGPPPVVVLAPTVALALVAVLAVLIDRFIQPT
jgi:hypothetical protein